MSVLSDFGDIMLSAASQVNLHNESSPSLNKRARTDGVERSNTSTNATKNRRLNPFAEDDESSSEEEDENEAAQPPAKKPMLEDVRLPLSTLNNNVGPRIQETSNPTLSKELMPNTSNEPSRSTWPQSTAIFSQATIDLLRPSSYQLRACDGRTIQTKERKRTVVPSYEEMVASRSRTAEGRAKKSYYGIDIHELMDAAKNSTSGQATTRPDVPLQTTEAPGPSGKKAKSLLWTEKYRARKFMDLCGDDGTNRQVLKWLKRWDGIVFPGLKKAPPIRPGRGRFNEEEEKPLRKILMLTGPPGLGKTTLAHVCAKQAGYEVLEINASDDRSRDVVKNRIRTSLGTESVKNVSNRKTDDNSSKVAKPVCVVVDEVDGVVTGAGASGEGGFVKALIDLVLTDQRNDPSGSGSGGDGRTYQNKKKGDDFRLMRPLILICNDVYHASLRPLRQSNLAEIIHVGKPSVEAVVGRLTAVFEKEGIPCDKDASRKLCEAAWGISSGLDAKRGSESTVQGDLRGVMVVGEWVAGRFRSSTLGANTRLSRQWIDANIINDLASGAAGSRGLGRGNVKDIVGRLFQEGGGFPKQAMNLSKSKTHHEQPKMELGFGEQQKKYSMERLTHMIETSGEISHIVNEIFTEYPNREFNDDSYLTKPNQAYDWLCFHDTCQSRLYLSQEWELAPYLSQPVLACHHLFASPKRHFDNNGKMGYDKRWKGDGEDEPEPLPFTGPRADFQAHECEKENRFQLQAMQSQLSPAMMRSFRSAEDMATEFLPYLARLVSPNVKPVVVGGSQGTTASVRKDSERKMVKRAAQVLAETGVELHKGKIEGDSVSRAPQFVYRLEPDLDALSTFETGVDLLSSQGPTRFAVRQVLDQELKLYLTQRDALARQARYRAGGAPDEIDTDAGPQQLATRAGSLKMMMPSGIGGEDRDGGKNAVKKDFFGRVIVPVVPLVEGGLENDAQEDQEETEERKVWVTYHEGLNNAVRKPISLAEFLKVL